MALYDADESSALAFVQEKLHDADVNTTLSQNEKAYVQRLGGRSVDLESVSRTSHWLHTTVDMPPLRYSL